MAGDPAVQEWLESRIAPTCPVAAAATVGPTGAAAAAVGAALDADYEIGSISKGVTGLPYVDALARGEVQPRTTLAELLDLGGAPAGALTLESLSTHRSGLPSLPARTGLLRRQLRLWRDGRNPYGESLAQVLAQVRGTEVGDPRPRYSNLGFQLLGHALAAASATTYRELLRDRVAQPLGLTSWYVPHSPAELQPTAVVGTSRRGRPRDAWTGEGLGPAGGIRSSIGDLAGFAEALLAGRAPGLGALDPVAPFGRGAQIGAGWITVEVGGRTVTWHNGGTGGFRTWFGLDRDAGTAAVVVAARHRSVDRHGFALLSALPLG